MPGTAREVSETFDDDEDGEEVPLAEVVMAAVFQSSRLGVAWYDSANGEVRDSHACLLHALRFDNSVVGFIFILQLLQGGMR